MNTHIYPAFVASPARPYLRPLRPLVTAAKAASRIHARLVARQTRRRFARFPDHRFADIGFVREWDGEIHRVGPELRP